MAVGPRLLLSGHPPSKDGSVRKLIELSFPLLLEGILVVNQLRVCKRVAV